MSEKQEDKIVLTLNNEVNEEEQEQVEETVKEPVKVSEEEVLAARVNDEGRCKAIPFKHRSNRTQT